MTYKNYLVGFCIGFISLIYANHVLAFEKVSIKLQWLHQFQFSGYYVAKEKGFYRDVGLDVDIIPYEEGSQDVVHMVKSGQATFGTGRSSLVAAWMNGKPVVIISAIFQDSPAVLLALKNNGIDNLKNLIGRKVMVSPDALLAADYIGMFAQENISPHDIIRQRHSYNLDDLINRKTDAMACYVSNEPYMLKEKGVPFIGFSPKDFGQDFYGDLLFTSKREVMESPERVKKFNEASLKGWVYAFENIEETANLIWRKYNKQNKSIESLIFEGAKLKKLALIPSVPLGNIDPNKIQKIADLYLSLGVIGSLRAIDGFIFSY